MGVKANYAAFHLSASRRKWYNLKHHPSYKGCSVYIHVFVGYHNLQYYPLNFSKMERIRKKKYKGRRSRLNVIYSVHLPIQDFPLGGGGGVPRGRFSVKRCATTKELAPVDGSTNGVHYEKITWNCDTKFSKLAIQLTQSRYPHPFVKICKSVNFKKNRTFMRRGDWPLSSPKLRLSPSNLKQFSCLQQKLQSTVQHNIL